MIQNYFKFHYRKLGILKWQLSRKSYDNTVEPIVISILDALRLLSRAFAKVPEKNIAKSFRHVMPNLSLKSQLKAVAKEKYNTKDHITLAVITRLRVPFEDYANFDEEEFTHHITISRSISFMPISS